MYFECSECENVVQSTVPAPFLCPRCGLVGVQFTRVDALSIVQYVLEGDDEPWEADVADETPWYVSRPVRATC